MLRRLNPARSAATLAATLLAAVAAQGAHAAINDPARRELADAARRAVAGHVVTDNRLDPADAHIGRELADQLVGALLDGLQSPKNQGSVVAFSAAHSKRTETYTAAAVIPIPGMPPETPIPLCFSTNGKPTSAWYLMPDGSTRAGLVVANLPQQVRAQRPACYATLFAARETMESNAKADAVSE